MVGKVSKKTVGIIGGNGKMGKQFGRMFKGLGFDVVVADVGTKMTNKQLIKQTDIVIFSVPLHVSEKVIKKEIKHCVRKDQIVMDISSLKEKQMKVMNGAGGSCIGLHPLFGPAQKNLSNLTMIMCKGKCDQKSFDYMKNLFKKLGLKIVEMTPKEHDKTMALIQVIPHLKTILSGELIKFLGMKPAKLYEIGTPIYKVELSIIGRIFSQDGDLYAAIISENPYSRKIVKQLSVLVKNYSVLMKRGDIATLTKRFNAVKKFLGGFTEKAFEDSEKIIGNL
ncbi:MAG: prephenate dehydrogenase/arogenate dehydrogenase family protein [Candidatus Gracilibacteria bacterium]|jgi:prephenate dehydrogenase